MTPASKTPQELFAYLDSLGIRHQTYEHPPVFTVADSLRTKTAIPGANTKNLLLKVKKKNRFFLVHMLGTAQLALKVLAKQLGQSNLSFASEEQLYQILKLQPGHVSPFGLINFNPAQQEAALPGFALEVILSQELMAYEQVNFHPLRNDMTTGVSSSALVRFLDSFAVGYRIMALPQAPPAPTVP